MIEDGSEEESNMEIGHKFLTDIQKLIKDRAAGIHPKAVQERLEHSSINVTFTTHSSVLPDIQDEAADKLDKYLTLPDTN